MLSAKNKIQILIFLMLTITITCLPNGHAIARMGPGPGGGWGGGGGMAFSAKLLHEAGIVATPGIGFGSSGEGYVRFAITRPVVRIQEAIERMRRLDL